jgi:oxaloacetate decarboxylase gamma subunit
MNTDLILQGVELMLLGMGIVFAFLTILVFTLRGMSRLAAHLHDEEAVELAPAPINIADRRPLVAVITASVARYRASRAA